MHPQRLGNDLAHGQAGIEAPKRVLEDHLEVTAQRFERRGGKAGDRGAQPNNLPGVGPQPAQGRAGQG